MVSKTHKEFMEAVKKLPRIMVKKMLSEKMADFGLTIADEQLEEMAAHLMAGAQGPFVYDDGSGENINVKIEEGDFAKVLKDLNDFTEQKLADVVQQTASETAGRTLKALKSKWPDEYIYQMLEMDQFRGRLEERWGRAFEPLRILLTVSRDLGEQAARRSKNRTDTLPSLMIRLHARSCRVAAEIITLMENGYADGAMARWRTLHEISVVGTIIKEGGEELAIRYVSHQHVESKKALEEYKRTHQQLGFKPPGKRELKEVEKNYRLVLEKYGEEFDSQYGWAAHHLSNKRPTFAALQASAGRALMHSYYKMASYGVHATPKGVFFGLGSIRPGRIIAGASNAGFEEPAQNTAVTLTMTNLLILRSGWDIEDIVFMMIMSSLRDEVVARAIRAKSRLERDEKSYQRTLQERQLRKKRSTPCDPNVGQ